jgi:ATP-dependent Clp protease ATP-binding subunit ClpC
MSERKINDTAKVIIQHARIEAQNLDDVKCRPEHLILSILIANNNECVDVLTKMKINPLQLYDMMTEYIKTNDLRPKILIPKKNIPFSEDFNIAIKQVDNECDSLNDEEINTIHLMLAILTAKTSNAAKMLNGFNINYMNFKKMVKDMRDEPSSKPPYSDEASFDNEDDFEE